MANSKLSWVVFYTDGSTESSKISLVKWERATHVAFENDLFKNTVKIPKASAGHKWTLQHVHHSQKSDLEVYILVEVDKNFETKTAIHILPNGIIHSCHTSMCSLMQEYMKASFEGKLIAIENIHGRLQTHLDAVLKAK